MNVLPLIFAVLLVLGLFNAYQSDQFRRLLIMTSYYERSIRQEESATFNQRQYRLYKNARKSTGRAGEDRGQAKSLAKAKLNFKLILNQPSDVTNLDEYRQHVFLAKEVIHLLYHQTKFYRDLEQKRPQFIDELFTVLQQAAKGKKIQEPQDIEKLELHDPELQTFLYHIMKGKKHPPLTMEKIAVVQLEKIDGVEETQETEETEGAEEEDFVLEVSYASLKDLMQFTHQHKIYIYLAPKAILQAIFIDANLVEDIIKSREDFYTQVNKKKATERKEERKSFSLIFQQKFEAHKRPEISEALLDFTVTGTNPEKYNF